MMTRQNRRLRYQVAVSAALARVHALSGRDSATRELLVPL